jgi:hypothetical protein
MAVLGIWVGVMLIVLGVAGYVLTDMVSATALIPAFFGVVLAILGAVGKAPERRRTAMHIAMVVALLGILGSISGLPGLFTMLTGGTIARPAAAVSRSLMALLLIVYLGLGIRSFIQARRPTSGV